MKSQYIISGNTALLSVLIVFSMFQFGFCSQVWVGAGQNVLTYDTEGNYLSSFHAGGIQNVSAIEVINGNVWIANGQAASPCPGQQGSPILLNNRKRRSSGPWKPCSSL